MGLSQFQPYPVAVCTFKYPCLPGWDLYLDLGLHGPDCSTIVGAFALPPCRTVAFHQRVNQKLDFRNGPDLIRIDLGLVKDISSPLISLIGYGRHIHLIHWFCC